MGKITSYGCDYCDFLTKNKNEIFIPLSIQNGENEDIFANDKMFCSNCLIEVFTSAFETKRRPEVISKIFKNLKQNVEEEQITEQEEEQQEEQIIEEEEIEIEKPEENYELEKDSNFVYIKLQHIQSKEDEKMLLNYLGYKDTGELLKHTRLPTLTHSFIPVENGLNDLNLDECSSEDGGVIVDIQNKIPTIKLGSFYKTKEGEFYIHINELTRIKKNGEV